MVTNRRSWLGNILAMGAIPVPWWRRRPALTPMGQSLYNVLRAQGQYRPEVESITLVASDRERSRDKRYDLVKFRFTYSAGRDCYQPKGKDFVYWRLKHAIELVFPFQGGNVFESIRAAGDFEEINRRLGYQAFPSPIDKRSD